MKPANPQQRIANSFFQSKQKGVGTVVTPGIGGKCKINVCVDLEEAKRNWQSLMMPIVSQSLWTASVSYADAVGGHDLAVRNIYEFSKN